MHPSWLIVIITVGLAAAAGCDWDSFDPRENPLQGGGDAGGSDGGSGNTGGSGAQGAAPPGSVCASVSTLADDFEDDEPSPVWTPGGSGQVISDIGGLLSLGTGAAVADFANFTSTYFHDFSGEQEVIVDTVTLPAGNAVMRMEIRRDDANRLIIGWNNGNLELLSVVEGAAEVLANPVFNPSNNRVWRLRSDGETFYWESSADGSPPWGNHASKPLHSLFALDYVKVRLLVDNQEAVAHTGTFDNVRSDGVGTAWCPMEALVDDFADGRRDQKWLNTGGTPGAHSLEFNGQLFIDLPEDTLDASYFYRSSRLHDMRGPAGASVKIVEVPEPPITVRFIVTGPEGWLKLELFDNTLRANYFANMMETALPEENNHIIDGDGEYWRIREDGPDIVWEISQNGSTWTKFSGVTKPFDDLSAMYYEVGAITHAPNPTPTPLIFDDVNIVE